MQRARNGRLVSHGEIWIGHVFKTLTRPPLIEQTSSSTSRGQNYQRRRDIGVSNLKQITVHAGARPNDAERREVLAIIAERVVTARRRRACYPASNSDRIPPAAANIAASWSAKPMS
jgi:hypothetical protein